MKRAVIVVAGNRYHGKDTLADLLHKELEGSRRASYIWPLRVAVNAKTGIPWEILEGPRSVKDDPRFGRYGKSARQYLIEEGDHIRTQTHKAALVHRLVERALGASEPFTVVSDGRMPETEIKGVNKALLERGDDSTLVIPILITRASEPVDMSHPTESEIANASASLFRFVVANDSDLEALASLAADLADEIRSLLL